MSARLKVGILGAGLHGSRYAQHILADLEDIELVAISRRSKEGAAQARGWSCRYHADWRALVADANVEAVIAAATPDLNADIAERCASEGKPLLLEKPLAVDADAGERVLAASRHIPITVAQTLRYNSVILAMKRELPRAGQLYSFTAEQRLEPSTHSWLTNLAIAGGGVILHTAVHLFDAIRFITGREITAIRASAFKIHNPNLEDLMLAEMRLSEDIPGSVDVSKVGPARSGRYVFTGSEGQLSGDQIHGNLDWVHGARFETVEHFEALPTIPLLLTDWTAFLRGERENPIPAEEGFAALRICEAARHSALDREWVSL